MSDQTDNQQTADEPKADQTVEQVSDQASNVPAADLQGTEDAVKTEATTPVAQKPVEQPQQTRQERRQEQQRQQQQQKFAKPAPPQPVQQQALASKQDVKPEATQDAGDADFDRLIENLRVNGTSSEIALISSLDAYVAKMKPGMPVDFEDGVNQQYKLWMTLWRVLEESSNAEFNKLWNIVIGYFRKYQTGAMGGQYVNRFSEYWARDLDQLTAFQQMTNLLNVIVTDRPNLKKIVSIQRAVEKKFTETGRGRLIALYS